MAEEIRRKKGYEDMISGSIKVHIQLEDEHDPERYVVHVTFIGNSMSDGVDVIVEMEDKEVGKTISSGALNITRPHFNGIVGQLGKMKSMLNALRGENK